MDDTEGLNISLLYESTGLLGWDDGKVDLDDPKNLETPREYFKYFSEEFFNQTTYFHINGKPVIFMYASRAYTADVAGALREAE